MDSKIDTVVTKASGLAEPFSIKKLATSLARAKVTSEEIKVIIGASIPNLYKGISTKKIYSEALRLLRNQSKPQAATLRRFCKPAVLLSITLPKHSQGFNQLQTKITPFCTCL